MNLVYEPSKTTHWKNLFPSKTMLLGSHNLNEGEELIAKIKRVTIEQIKNTSGQTEHVPVLHFDGKVPPMVLNITNSRSIASLYGEHYDHWEGCSVQIFATKVKAFGIEQMALRIREAIPDTNQDISEYDDALRACTTIQDLQKVFMSIPKHLKPKLVATKDEIKEALSEKN
ncbi:MAG: hypothetical protein EP323_00295 [Gammaproteobacteria bacterium]|nr:MAG: hypothetical protein EP323_00295 [Gammaproteobacteria bacterium]